jgi:hypothetical protein
LTSEGAGCQSEPTLGWKGGPHAQETKRDDEKGHSEAKIEVGSQESSKKEAESHR